MTFEQVERHYINQLWLPLEGCEHIGREAGRRLPLTRAILADFALASNRSARSGSCHRSSPTRRL
jgi:hypothetical protein